MFFVFGLNRSTYTTGPVGNIGWLNIPFSTRFHVSLSFVRARETSIVGCTVREHPKPVRSAGFHNRSLIGGNKNKKKRGRKGTKRVSVQQLTVQPGMCCNIPSLRIKSSQKTKVNQWCSEAKERRSCAKKTWSYYWCECPSRKRRPPRTEMGITKKRSQKCLDISSRTGIRNQLRPPVHQGKHGDCQTWWNNRLRVFSLLLSPPPPRVATVPQT